MNMHVQINAVEAFAAAAKPETETLTTMAAELARRIPATDTSKSPYYKVHHCITGALGTAMCCEAPEDLGVLYNNLGGYVFRLEAMEHQVEAELRPSAHIEAMRTKLAGFLPS